MICPVHGITESRCAQVFDYLLSIIFAVSLMINPQSF
jgi:hypothetical protein